MSPSLTLSLVLDQALQSMAAHWRQCRGVSLSLSLFLAILTGVAWTLSPVSLGVTVAGTISGPGPGPIVNAGNFVASVTVAVSGA